MEETTPLYGLVLAGGKSNRMGRDKGLITYHELPQREHLYRLLQPLCNRVFLSVRTEQVADLDSETDYIVDEDLYRGPFNGLLSAHRRYPEVAWLVLACDLPLMETTGLQRLIAARDPSKVATAYATKQSGLPEPLAAIWESRGLQQAELHMKTATSSCPRKFLINSDIELVEAMQDELLANANNPEEYLIIREKLSLL